MWWERMKQAPGLEDQAEPAEGLAWGQAREAAGSRGLCVDALTLDDDESRGVDAVHGVGGEAGVLATILPFHVLDVEAAGRRDAHPRVSGHGGPVASGPGDPWRGMACGAALQGHTFPHQHLRVLGLDYKSGTSCHRKHRFRIKILQFSECLRLAFLFSWYSFWLLKSKISNTETIQLHALSPFFFQEMCRPQRGSVASGQTTISSPDWPDSFFKHGPNSA